ncbi:MAG: aminobenzoate synthetase [Proteobacteria bacterium SG_bin6]|nr:MAG: aminobenzoate synthetase [Proteobacteria bacterium SG_bin6]
MVFILLDDARPGGAAPRLYAEPRHIVTAATLAEVRPALDTIAAAVAQGAHAAGFLAYEAAPAFEPALPAQPPAPGVPLLWFGLFDEPTPFDPATLPDPAGAWAGVPEPLIDRATYDRQLAALAELIRAGDLYQGNLTYPARVPIAGDLLALYARLRAAQAGYGAFIDTASLRIASLSPELFVALDGDRLTCRPMKGTARRLADPAADAAAPRALAADPKQRAENLMIVDLMRNDLTRVAAPGSVAVPELFAIESYPTVHQMTSTVTARLGDGRDWRDVLAALFPCGSISGAPKLRAIEALAAIEGRPRGLYTGTIGYIEPGGDACFSVAIRTLVERAGTVTLGLGSGIVADSRAEAEWQETRDKAAFVTAGAPRFDLIETMAFDPARGVPLIERHLARMKASARALGFAFDRHAARNELQAATFRLAAPSRVRLLLARSGAIAIETAPLPATPEEVTVALAPHPLAPADYRRHHKTSDRAAWERGRLPGTFETIYVDPDGALAEGSFTSLFVPRDAVLLTPPAARVLPGVLRAELLTTGAAREADLTPADLAAGFFIGNALRGLIPARLLAATPAL